jgi:hypothetical protein
MSNNEVMAGDKDAIRAGLEALRAPFEDRLIGKLPKPTKAQTDAVKADFKTGIRCNVCGGWHHKDVVHLDYVGHAAITDRLLEVDPCWSWEPMALNEFGLPAQDKLGGLWIKLTILGVTRIGYGDATGKTGGDAIKELIGDALRNAAMRFGCALELWHKGELHAPEAPDEVAAPLPDTAPQPEAISDARLAAAISKIKAGEYSLEKLTKKFILNERQKELVSLQLSQEPQQ